MTTPIKMDRPSGRPMPVWPKSEAEQIDRIAASARRFSEDMQAESAKARGLNLYPDDLIRAAQIADVQMAQHIIEAHATKIVDRLHTMPDNLRDGYRSDALKLCKSVEVMFILVAQCHGQIDLFRQMMARHSELTSSLERVQIKLTEASAEIERLQDEIVNQ